GQQAAAPGMPKMPPAQPAANPSATPEYKVQRIDFDMKQVAMPSALSASALQGRKLFVQRCAACHDPSANTEFAPYAPKLPGSRMATLGDAALRAKIADGSARMPGFKYMFSQEQVDRLVEYLKTR